MDCVVSAIAQIDRLMSCQFEDCRQVRALARTYFGSPPKPWSMQHGRARDFLGASENMVKTRVWYAAAAEVPTATQSGGILPNPP
jgi:hypothetical protein